MLSPDFDLRLGKTLIRRIRADWLRGDTTLQRDRLACLQHCCFSCRVPVLQALANSLEARWLHQHAERLPKFPSKTSRRLRIARGKPPYSPFELYYQQHQQGRRLVRSGRRSCATPN